MICIAIASVLVIVAGCSKPVEDPSAPTTFAMAVNDQKIEQIDGEKPSEEPSDVQQDNVTLSDFTIQIIGCARVKNYEGEPAIVVGYTWTNNSEETRVFEKSVDDQAYQGGNQLEHTILSTRYEQFDMNASYAEVKSGETITAYQAFLLKNESDIVIQVKNWHDFGSNEVIKRTFKCPTEEQE